MLASFPGSCAWAREPGNEANGVCIHSLAWTDQPLTMYLKMSQTRSLMEKPSSIKNLFLLSTHEVTCPIMLGPEGVRIMEMFGK